MTVHVTLVGRFINLVRHSLTKFHSAHALGMFTWSAVSLTRRSQPVQANMSSQEASYLSEFVNNNFFKKNNGDEKRLIVLKRCFY